MSLNNCKCSPFNRTLLITEYLELSGQVRSPHLAFRISNFVFRFSLFEFRFSVFALLPRPFPPRTSFDTSTSEYILTLGN
jgi:hypothetical protein